MKTWEYKVVVVFSRLLASDDPENDESRSRLAKLGEDGLELASVVYEKDRSFAYFKRPLE